MGLFWYFGVNFYVGFVANLVSYPPCEHKVSGSIPRPAQTWDARGLEPRASNGKNDFRHVTLPLDYAISEWQQEIQAISGCWSILSSVAVVQCRVFLPSSYLPSMSTVPPEWSASASGDVPSSDMFRQM